MSTVAADMPSVTQGIPVKRVVIDDPSQMPHDLGTTPGGTLFSTTPGGTRIVYERSFLLQCRKSPHSLSPPANLPVIPGVTTDLDQPKRNGSVPNAQPKGSKQGTKGELPLSVPTEDAQFDMDM